MKLNSGAVTSKSYSTSTPRKVTVLLFRRRSLPSSPVTSSLSGSVFEIWGKNMYSLATATSRVPSIRNCVAPART